jgi:hypothetical protein
MKTHCIWIIYLRLVLSPSAETFPKLDQGGNHETAPATFGFAARSWHRTCGVPMPWYVRTRPTQFPLAKPASSIPWAARCLACAAGLALLVILTLFLPQHPSHDARRLRSHLIPFCISATEGKRYVQ